MHLVGFTVEIVMTCFKVDSSSTSLEERPKNETVSQYDEDRDRNTKQYSKYIFNKVGTNNRKAALITNKIISGKYLIY